MTRYTNRKGVWDMLRNAEMVVSRIVEWVSENGHGIIDWITECGKESL
jgi:hypothetical protein